MIPLVVLSTACGSDGAPSLATPTCGEPGPALLLAAPAGELIRVVAEAGDRYVVAVGAGAVGVDGARVRTVGKCGEDPQAMPEAGEIHVDGERLWVVQGERVGHWPVAGGAITWEAEGVAALGLLPGRGFVVLDPVTQAADLLPGDGSRLPIFSGVFVDTTLEADRLELERFQAAGDVVAFLDDQSELQVVDVDDPTSARLLTDVGSFALGPDGTWFVTKAGNAGFEHAVVRSRGEATFHELDGVDTVALGESHIVASNVHPAGWVRLDREHLGSEYFDLSTRALVPAPLPLLDGTFRDDAGGIYANTGSAIVRWDPFAQIIEEKAPSPEGARVDAIDPDAALAFRDTAGPTPFSVQNAEALVVPFDGSAAFTIPDRVDAAWLLPGATALYTPAVTPEPADVGALRWIAEDGEPIEIEAMASLSGVVPFAYDAGEHSITYRVEDGERSGLWRAALP